MRALLGTEMLPWELDAGAFDIINPREARPLLAGLLRRAARISAGCRARLNDVNHVFTGSIAYGEWL